MYYCLVVHVVNTVAGVLNVVGTNPEIIRKTVAEFKFILIPQPSCYLVMCVGVAWEKMLKYQTSVSIKSIEHNTML